MSTYSEHVAAVEAVTGPPVAASMNSDGCVPIAYAILALAEQQRIANLIALAESGRTTVNGARAALSALYDGRIEDGTAHMTLRPDIADALGITEQADSKTAGAA